MVPSPLVIMDSSVIIKMSTITREFTISREIKAKIDNQTTEHIHYNERFHYYEMHYVLPEATVLCAAWFFELFNFKMKTKCPVHLPGQNEN